MVTLMGANPAYASGLAIVLTALMVFTVSVLTRAPHGPASITGLSCPVTDPMTFAVVDAHCG